MADPTLLTEQYKDHTVENAVEYLEEDKLPFNARSVHMQPIRNLSVTIQVLDEDETVLETITGLAKSGSIKMESSSLVRRSASLTLITTDETFPQSDSLIWFNRIIKFYVGIQDLSQVNTNVNFLLGTYWIDETDFSVDAENNEVSVTLRDKMTLYEDKKIENKIKIPIDTPINEAIRLVMEDIGETKFGNIDNVKEDEVVPYTMEYEIGDNAIDIITDLRDMYMDYICGYNIRGEFEFKKLEVQKEDLVAEPKWRFDSQNEDRSDLTLSFKESYSLKNIKNRIVVYGGTSDVTGLTPVGESRITDTSSPFNIYAIGERTDIVTESKYVTNEQCDAKARYEVLQSSNFKEVCNINCVPIYIIDAYDTIEVIHPKTKQKNKYIVDSFDFDLFPEATMNINAHKLYYTVLEYGADKNPLVDAIVRGINNWGWLSLGEERIKDCFNIMGSGSATLNVMFQDVIEGGEQASVTSYPTTKNQTLMIDLADFAELDFKNENGDSGRNTGDYADRVLAHEMFHAVTNDYLGHDTMVSLPIWFKEGFAEFLHGAKERFSDAYNSDNNTNKKEKLISLAQDILNDKWVGMSEEYVASYLIAIAIYRKSSESQWKNLFIRLKTQKNPSINFLYKLLPVADTNDKVKELIINEIRNMNDVWEFLFDKNDTDTGSVGGIHFMNLYGIPLDAETVINNANATTISIGFQVKINR